MGIPGLQTTFLKNQDKIVEYVDLIEKAKELGQIEILVDFYAFENYILKAMTMSLEKHYKNPAFHIPGGEYALIDQWYTKIVTDLKSLGITLVWFIDGAKGSNVRGAEQKFDAWRTRQLRDIKLVDQYVVACRNGTHVDNHKDKFDVLRPPLLNIQILDTLVTCGCEIIQCSGGEADYVIAQALQERPHAFAIISNDSDFCVFRGCTYIPNPLFDLDSDLGLEEGLAQPRCPRKLRVGLVSNEKIMDFFKFRNFDQMVDLSVLSSNDFTGVHIRNHRDFWQKLSLKPSIPGKRWPQLMDIVAWINKCPDGSILKNDAFMQILRTDHEFASSVDYSRSFYELRLRKSVSGQGSALTQFLDTKIKGLSLHCTLMGMHRKMYWHRPLVEDLSQGTPGIEELLTPIRQRIYRFILGTGDKGADAASQSSLSVLEFGRGPDPARLKEIRIRPVTERQLSGCTTANLVREDSMEGNTRLFRDIMLHQEQDGSTLDYMAQFGRAKGLLCLCLRYMLTLNWRQNLHLKREEFETLCSSVLGLASPELAAELPSYYKCYICPNERCITIWNWFQFIYLYAYGFLAQLLYLKDGMPQPKDVLSSALFFAFYMERMCEDKLSVTAQDKNAIRIDRNWADNEMSAVFPAVTRGIF